MADWTGTPLTLGGLSGVFVRICMQVLAVIGHFALPFSWVVFFRASISDARRGCFHMGKVFHCQNTLSNVSLVMEKGEKKAGGGGRTRYVRCNM